MARGAAKSHFSPPDGYGAEELEKSSGLIADEIPSIAIDTHADFLYKDVEGQAAKKIDAMRFWSGPRDFPDLS